MTHGTPGATLTKAMPGAGCALYAGSVRNGPFDIEPAIE